MFSHEVRAPVVTIMGLANIFNFDKSTSPVNKEVMERILDPINDLNSVVSHIVFETNELEIGDTSAKRKNGN